MHYHGEIIYDTESTRTEDAGHREVPRGLTRLTFLLSPFPPAQEIGIEIDVALQMCVPRLVEPMIDCVVRHSCSSALPSYRAIADVKIKCSVRNEKCGQQAISLSNLLINEILQERIFYFGFIENLILFL